VNDDQKEKWLSVCYHCQAWKVNRCCYIISVVVMLTDEPMFD